MIARITGKVVDKTGQALVVDVGGVGYEVQVTLDDYEHFPLDKEACLHTYHYIREQSQELFGFSEPTAKQLFEQLLSVNGVGPRMALAIMSVGEPAGLRAAIANGDSAYISQANGVGKRIADRVVVDLRDKVGPATVGLPVSPNNYDDAQNALVSLGYTAQQAALALASVDRELSVEDRIKAALKELGK